LTENRIGGERFSEGLAGNWIAVPAKKKERKKTGVKETSNILEGQHQEGREKRGG